MNVAVTIFVPAHPADDLPFLGDIRNHGLRAQGQDCRCEVPGPRFPPVAQKTTEEYSVGIPLQEMDTAILPYIEPPGTQ